MRILKRTVFILLLLIAIPVGGIVSLLSGFWEYNARLEKDSFWIRQLEDRTGLDLEFERPIFVKLGSEFSLNTGPIRVLNPSITSLKPSITSHDGSVLAQWSELDMIGQLSLAVLWGEMPLFEEIRMNNLNIHIGHDARMGWLLPKFAEFPFLSSQDNGSVLIPSAYAQTYAQLENIPINNLVLRNARIEVHDQKIQHIIEVASLDFVMPRPYSDGYLRVESSYNGLPVTVDMAATRQWDISGDMSVSSIDMNIEGRLVHRNTDLLIAVKVGDTQAIAEVAQIALPTGPFILKGNLIHSERRLSFSLQELLAQNSSLKGEFIISFVGRAMLGKLEGKQLTVEDFLPAAPKAEQTVQHSEAVVQEDSARIIQDIPIPNILLREKFLPDFSDLELTFDFSKIVFDSIVLRNITGLLDADHKGLSIDLENLSLGLGGVLRGDSKVKVGSDPEFSVDLSLEGLPISTFQPFFPVISHLDGIINAQIQGASSGENIRKIADQYTGKIRASLNDGYIQLPGQMPMQLEMISPTILENGLMILQCIDLVGNFENGLDKQFDWVLLSDALHSRGHGTVDLGKELLDIDSLTELSVLNNNMGLSVSIGGLFSHPDIQADYQGLLSGNVVSDLPKINGDLSVCHDLVASRFSEVDQDYSGLPANHIATSLLKNDEFDGLGKSLNTIQEQLDTQITGDSKAIEQRVKEKLQEVVGETLERQLEQKLPDSTGGAGGNTAPTDLLKQGMETILKSGGNDAPSLEELGKSLLGGLGN